MPRRLVTVLILLLFAGPLRAQVISRPIVVPAAARQADVALLSFYSGGHVDRPGTGLAVVGANDQPVGRRILANDPNGQTWLAVDLSGGAEGLRLEYSRQPLRTAKVDDDLPASLIMRIFPLKGRPVQKVDNLERVLQGKLPMGTMQVDNIFIAHNPFGESEWFMTAIEGLITVDKARTLALFSAHDDAAFVELDGTWIIKSTKPQMNRGSEQLAGQAKALDLSAGTHRLRYLHAQRKDASLALLGFMSGQRALPLPAHLFVHHPVAQLGDARGLGDKPAVGFDAQQLDQLGYGKTIYSRWRLTPIAAAPPDARYRWDFGDGVALAQGTSAAEGASGRALEHIFVGRIDDLGRWTVKLELVAGEGGQRVLGQAQSLLRAESVSNVQSTTNESLVRTYAKAVHGNDYRKAPALLMRRLYSLLATTEDPTLIAPLVEAFVIGAGREADSGGWDMRYALAGHLARDEPERAAKLYLELARSGKDTWKSTCAAAQHVDLAIFRLGKGAQIKPLVYSLFSGRAPRERSLLLARLGDVHRLAGDVDAAAKAYQEAQQMSYRQMDARQESVRDRAYREAAVNLLSQQRYPALRDMLFQWEADFPVSKLGTDLPLLIGRYYQATGDDPRAAIEFETLLKLNPMHPSRPEIVFRLGQSLARQGKNDEAGKCFAEVATKYPNSPFAADAASWKP